ncbi:hypothetical protein NPIL_175051 [Nephila pilipes]|uniref:Uncharacterized protein n=1 Tax=Nephila pilipes TaxID=299642 RepID=A0A8X6T023_NEPPI|nr:hypothetical protein NPIL_175051 [Nephila pilipes]
MNINPVTCHSLEGNTGRSPDEIFFMFVRQICNNDGYVGTSIDYHSTVDFVHTPHNKKSVVPATYGKNMKHFEMGFLTSTPHISFLTLDYFPPILDVGQFLRTCTDAPQVQH